MVSLVLGRLCEGELMMEYLIVIYRMITVIMIFLLVALMMGKRHIGELSVFDLIIAVTLGAVAGADLADPKVPHGPTLFAIAGLGLIHIFLSRVVLKSRLAGKWLSFDPTIVIENGVILERNLEKLRYTVDELLTHLREKEVFDIGEVEFAILEPSGALSVQKKSQYRSVKLKDLDLDSEYEGLSTAVVLEGKISLEGLRAVGLSEEWLQDRLRERGYEVSDVFLAILNTKGELYVSPLGALARETLAV